MRSARLPVEAARGAALQADYYKPMFADLRLG